MPTYTAPLLNHIATASLDWWLNKGTAFQEAIQEKPLLAAMESKKKTFPGGKGNIVVSVKGDFGNTAAPGTADQLVGYQLDDAVTYYTPANLTQAIFPWKEMHIGIMLTHSELKTDGITVTDSGDMDDTKEHSGRDDTVLVGLLAGRAARRFRAVRPRHEQSAVDERHGRSEGAGRHGSAHHRYARYGYRCGHRSRRRTWWRNRAYTAAMGTAVGTTPALAAWGGGAITPSATNGGALITLLQKEYRQLTRYGGKPNTAFCGIRLARGSRNRAARQRQLLDDRLLRRQGCVRRTDQLHGDGLRVRPDPRRARQVQALLLVRQQGHLSWLRCRTSGATSIPPSGRRTSTSSTARSPRQASSVPGGSTAPS